MVRGKKNTRYCNRMLMKIHVCLNEARSATILRLVGGAMLREYLIEKVNYPLSELQNSKMCRGGIGASIIADYASNVSIIFHHQPARAHYVNYTLIIELYNARCVRHHN